jgi:hypothetical protein
VKNTLAYYENSYITRVKSFMILAPEPNVIKLFCLQSMNFVIS